MLLKQNIVDDYRVLSFSDDSSFIEFCKRLVPVKKIDNETGMEYLDYPFENPDSKNIEHNKLLYEITDSNSEIMKNGYITLGNMRIFIPNLCRIQKMH